MTDETQTTGTAGDVPATTTERPATYTGYIDPVEDAPESAPETPETDEGTETPAEPAEAPTDAPTAPDVVQRETDRPLNDTGSVNDPVIGHFVDVTGGEHEGRYGTFNSVSPDGKNAVVRTRDEYTDYLIVPIEYLRPAKAGRR